MESCPRKLYDILRPEEYPPTGRCPVLIFDFGDDKQVLSLLLFLFILMLGVTI